MVVTHPAAFMAEVTQAEAAWVVDFPGEAVMAHGVVVVATIHGVEAAIALGAEAVIVRGVAEVTTADHMYHPHHEGQMETMEADVAAAPWAAEHLFLSY